MAGADSTKKLWEAAVRAFGEGDWKTARGHFERHARMLPADRRERDKAGKFMIDFLAGRDTPPADWKEKPAIELDQK